MIACPHAVGLAIPLEVAITTPLAASNGILLSPAVEALLMSLSTVIVAINTQLLRREQTTA